MKFPPQFLDRIRESILPSEIIGKAVRLQSKGRGEYTGLCPFHKEKTPSFTVSDDKGFYHCFGCGVHGDIIKFSMENRGMSFAEAVKYLADEAGLQMPQPSYEDVVTETRQKSIYDAMELAAAWYEKQLFSPLGKPSLDYLTKRGLKKSDIEKFRLGYAPDTNSSLRNYLLGQGITDKVMQEGGLTLHDEGRQDIDRFRGRIIFPICNINSKVIAFGGRALRDDQMPKYLNSPETEIFKKGFCLYGLHLAKEQARKTNEIIAVEGYMDVIAMQTAGITNTVAPLGTALTENQLKLLWKFAQEPVICLDGDAAGRRAMARVAENFTSLLQPGLSIRFALLPQGQDPDDVIKSQGPEMVKSVVSKALPLSEIIWDIETGEQEIKTPEQIAHLEKRLNIIANSIQDASVKTYYHNYFKNKMWEGYSRQKQTNKNASKRSAEVVEMSAYTPPSALHMAEQLLVSHIMQHPYLLKEHEIEEEFARIDFTLLPLDKTRVFILESFTHNPDLTGEDLYTQLKNAGMLPKAQNKMQKFTRNNDSNHELAKSGWRYYLALYNLNSFTFEAERFTAFNTDQDNYDEKQSEFKRQVAMLEQAAEKEKQSFESIYPTLEN